MKDLKISPFLFTFKMKNEDYVVYNSLLLKRFYTNKKIINKIKNLDFEKNDDLLSYLYNNRFVIDSHIKPRDEINRLIKKEKLYFDKPIFKVFYMIITTGCNFRCKYCYLSSLTNYAPRIMDLNTAKKSLNFFYKYIRKVKDEIPKLVLYGGEPLLNKKVLKFIVRKVREKIKQKEIPFVNLIMITNGVLLDDEISKFLKKHKVLVALSLDGPKRINDSNRIYKNGKGTYKDIVKAIKILKRNKINPTISCTISDKNVNKLKQIIPFIVKKFKINSLGLNLFAGGDCSKKVIRQLSKNTSKKIIDAFKICRKYGVYEDTVLRQIKAFVNEKPKIYNCAATGREIAVDPAGNLATCPAFLNTKLFPLNINKNPKLENDERFRKWTKRTPLLNEKCYNCIALGVCGGGCAYNSYINHKSINGMDDFYCNYAKNVTKWILKDLYTIMKKRKDQIM